MLELLSANFDTLPADLLPEAKEHMRVEFDRDDDYIRGCVARAIAEVEACTDLTLTPSEWLWAPDPCDWQVMRATRYGPKIPKTPTRQVFTVDLAGVQTDIPLTRFESSAYLPKSNRSLTDIHILAGYENKQQMPPSVMNPLLLIAGTLYETRESLQFGSLSELPDMTRRLLSGLWRPSV